ncbi:right-handed parallel beta-helix repeat-containing protein [Metabacillus idriensis]|uniref:right-handed parallel beta-helix repeat-containing protein n=1 Tax=Metabacillus idriensis TaxID=324768 RepID=UPI00174D90A9|nr:right-handed parallel beta-helix repeat-containing protein [Metabacillus idriensis]
MAKIQVLYVLKVNLPKLEIGELGFATDTDELFIGSSTGNLELTKQSNLGLLSELTTVNQSSLVKAINEVNQYKGSFVTNNKINGSIVVNDADMEVYDDSGKAYFDHEHMLGDLTDVNVRTVVPTEGHVLQYQGGQWKPGAGVVIENNSYIIDLSHWGIKVNETDLSNMSVATSNSTAINNALTWASAEGYTELVFPKGQGMYLIYESIQPKSFMTLNLNGCTLRMVNNGDPGYEVISYKERQRFSRVTNGIIEGDRYEHNYNTEVGTHEWGFGIYVEKACKYISIDNLEIKYCTGDGFNSTSGYNAIPDNTSFWTFKDTFILGGFDKLTGSVNLDPKRIRSTVKIDLEYALIADAGAFRIDGNGYSGTGDVSAKMLDVLFLKKDNSYHSFDTVRMQDTIMCPKGAKWAMIAFHQSTIPKDGGNQLSVRYLDSPRFIFIEKCDIHHNRRLGLHPSGQYMYIRNNEIHYNFGTGPNGGMDIEDGGKANQNIFIENNHFHHNGNLNLILVSGRHIRIRNNTFELNAVIIYPDVFNCIVSENNFISVGTIRLDGEVLFCNNFLFRSTVGGTNEWSSERQVKIDSCMLHNSMLSLQRNIAFTMEVTNCKIFHDSDSDRSSIAFYGAPQSISNCTIIGRGFDVYSGKSGWIFENVRFRDVISLRLVAGRYFNCLFANTIKINLTGVNSIYEMDKCYFEWAGDSLFDSEPIIDTLSIKSSVFKGNNHKAFFLWQLGKKFELIGNKFMFPNATSLFSIVQFFYARCDKFIAKNNEFTSNQPLYAITYTETDIITEFKGNSLERVILPTQPFVNLVDNIVNGYKWSTTEPTVGFYKLGDQVENAGPVVGGYIGWICTTEGTINNSEWIARSIYRNGNYVHAGGKVYKCTVGGTTGGVPPSHTTGLGVDGTVTWKYISEKAVFKPYGLISD